MFSSFVPQRKFLWVLSKLDEYFFADGQVHSRLKDEKRTHYADTNGPMSPDALQIRYRAMLLWFLASQSSSALCFADMLLLPVAARVF